MPLVLAYTPYADCISWAPLRNMWNMSLTPFKLPSCGNDFFTGHTRRCVTREYRSGGLAPKAALDSKFQPKFRIQRSCMQVTPDDASLLCALGDITLDDKHYQKAWDMSKGRSTRAQRSLARSAQRQQHWEEVGSLICFCTEDHYGDPLFPLFTTQPH